MPKQGSLGSVFYPQTKLDGSRAAGGSYGAKTAGEVLVGSVASRRAKRDEWSIQTSSETTRRRVNMAIEYVKERGSKIEQGLFAHNSGFLAHCEVLVSCAKRARVREGPALVPKGEWGRYGKGSRTPERRGIWIEIRFICLTNPRHHIYAGQAG